MLSVSEFMVMWTFISVLATGMMIYAAFIFLRQHIDARAEMTDNRRLQEWKAHQEWLFNQLYNMAPGKVLKPDEIMEETETKPATVFSPTEDPMAEFTGERDDWR